MPLVLGVDSSTQSAKVEVRDAGDGTVVGTGRAPHPAVAPPRSEQDPEAWWQALESAVHTAGVERVDAVSVAGQQHGLVCLDRQGNVVRPAKLWNDTESAPQAAALVEALGPEAWADATGAVPVASFTVTKLAWLAENEPGNLARLDKVLLPHDWLTWRLAGRFVTDRGDASGTGYWSPFSGEWRPDLLALVDPDRDWLPALPEVLAPTTPVGEGLGPVEPARGALVGPGTGDNMAAALALGLRPGDVAVSLGTSGTVYAVSERPVSDPSGAVAGFADATGRFLPLVCTLNCTRVTDWCARLLGVPLGELGDLAATAAPGAGGVTLVPYLDGERTPNRPHATGALHGFGSATTPSEIARAAYEGVVCSLLDCLDALRRGGVDTSGDVFVVGGGARSSVYVRTLADLLQRPVRVPRAGELVAAGAAVQAAAVLHGTDPSEVARSWGLAEGSEIEPVLDADVAGAVRLRYAARRDLQ